MINVGCGDNIAVMNLCYWITVLMLFNGDVYVYCCFISRLNAQHMWLLYKHDPWINIHVQWFYVYKCIFVISIISILNVWCPYLNCYLTLVILWIIFLNTFFIFDIALNKFVNNQVGPLTLREAAQFKLTYQYNELYCISIHC